MKRTGVGALILYMSAQAAASFAPEAAANEARAVAPATEAPRAQRVQRLVLADPTWDAFVFASAASALALEFAVVPDALASGASWAFLAPEPQFDYLAALVDTGIVPAASDTAPAEGGWLS